jgi:tRNA G26 N,N-dimethylase Trm1
MLIDVREVKEITEAHILLEIMDMITEKIKAYETTAKYTFSLKLPDKIIAEVIKGLKELGYEISISEPFGTNIQITWKFIYE